MRNKNPLSLAEGKFDLFLAAGQNLHGHQAPAGSQIAVLEHTANDLRRILNTAA
jgi:hypothetical protein